MKKNSTDYSFINYVFAQITKDEYLIYEIENSGRIEFLEKAEKDSLEKEKAITFSYS